MTLSIQRRLAMGIFKSLKGKIDVGTDPASRDNDDQYQAYSTAEEKRRVFGHSTTADTNNHQSSSSMMSSEQSSYAPPPGPPPSHLQRDDTDFFAPPPGPPPPSHRQQQRQQETYLPPPGPPPPSDNPPPYHDWTVIPDTALLPPPPPLPQDYSPTNNATYDSAARAHEWCARHPVYTPSRPSADIHTLARTGHLTLERPPSAITGSKNFILRQVSPTTWSIRTSTAPAQQDAIILSSIPLYFAAADNPLLTSRPITIYFEIHVQRISSANSGIAIGFAAKPYPPWRLPGWHRASIGVHGDDGRRFVHDSWGGRDFVDAFKPGDTVGVGIKFSTTPAGPPEPDSRSGKAKVEGIGRVKTTAFVTRDGQTNKDWEWDIDEERDERDEGVDGLMGEGDLYPAIGVFGGVEFEVRFGQGQTWV